MVRPRLLLRQRQRFPMPQPGIRRQRRQRRATSQWRRRSQLGDPCPLPTLGVTPKARSVPTPRLHRRRWRWCLGGGSGRAPSKKRHRSHSPACCLVPTRSLAKLRQQSCGSGRRLNRIIRVIGFLQYGLTEAVNLRNTYPVLEPYCALLILNEVWTCTFSHQIFDFSNFSITDLTFVDFLLQGRFHFNSDPFSVCNYS
jgi:hypothetical protein